jgi:hypothetical protein
MESFSELKKSDRKIKNSANLSLPVWSLDEPQFPAEGADYSKADCSPPLLQGTGTVPKAVSVNQSSATRCWFPHSTGGYTGPVCHLLRGKIVFLKLATLFLVLLSPLSVLNRPM